MSTLYGRGGGGLAVSKSSSYASSAGSWFSLSSAPARAPPPRPPRGGVSSPAECGVILSPRSPPVAPLCTERHERASSNTLSQRVQSVRGEGRGVSD